jgi:thiol:disulfide interchange protein DsbD
MHFIKKITIFSLALLTGTLAMAQSDKEVNWSYAVKKISDKVYEVHMMASIVAGWHIYSQHGGEGPVSTSFTFTKNPLVGFNNQPKEVGRMITKYEDAFKSQVRYYENTVDFVQTVTLKSNTKTAVTGRVEFMVCNVHECLPPTDMEFKVIVGR